MRMIVTVTLLYTRGDRLSTVKSPARVRWVVHGRAGIEAWIHFTQARLSFPEPWALTSSGTGKWGPGQGPY